MSLAHVFEGFLFESPRELYLFEDVNGIWREMIPGQVWEVTMIMSLMEEDQFSYSIANRTAGFQTVRAVEVFDAVLSKILSVAIETKTTKANAFSVHVRTMKTRTVGNEIEFKSIRDAKAYVKRKGGFATISARIGTAWVPVMSYEIGIGFKRLKVYNGLKPTGPYLRFT